MFIFLCHRKKKCCCFFFLSPILRLNFNLTINGINILDNDKKLSEYNLLNGDLIYILNEIISMDQPLTLDEVRDFQIYPLLMHRLMEYSKPDSDFDFIVLVLHALMIESGFQMVRKRFDFFFFWCKKKTNFLIYILGYG